MAHLDNKQVISSSTREALKQKLLEPKLMYLAFNSTCLILFILYVTFFLSTPIEKNTSLSLYLFLRGIFHWIYFELTFFLLVKYLSNKVTGAVNLFLVFLIVSLSDLFKTYSILLINISVDEFILSNFFSSISFLFLLLTGFIFIWYISTLINTHFQIYEYGPPIFVISLFLTYIILDKIGELESILLGGDQLLFIILGVRLSSWLMVSIIVYFFYIGIYSTFHLRRMRIHLRNENLKSAFSYFSICVILLFILLPISSAGLYFWMDSRLYNFSYQLLVTIVPLIGMALAVYPFLRMKDAISIQPGLAESVIILREGGMVVYHHEFLKSSEEDSSIHLFSGLLTMISSLFKETRKISDEIDYIEFENKTIITRSDENIFYVLISEKTTPNLIQNFDNFCNCFYQEFIADIRKAELMHIFMGSKERITDLVHRSFGY